MPKEISFLFPGQGAQVIGMGKDLAEQFPAARSIFDQADSILGFPLSRLCWEGPQQELVRTENCQPALYVTSFAALAALESELKSRHVILTPAATAGLSLGEYTALAAAGVFSFADGLKLVQLRGQAMEEASRITQGTMASVLGLDLNVLEAVCASSGAQVANINAPGQVVISGSVKTVKAASEQAKEKGAQRVIPLEVGGAFHSRLMDPAAAQLEKALQLTRLGELRCRVVSNVTGSFYSESGQAVTLLTRQLTHPVRWEACMQTLLKSGIRNFLEIGAGTVLKGLLRTMDPEAQVISVGTADQVREAAAQLASA